MILQAYKMLYTISNHKTHKNIYVGIRYSTYCSVENKIFESIKYKHRKNQINLNKQVIII